MHSDQGTPPFMALEQLQARAIPGIRHTAPNDVESFVSTFLFLCMSNVGPYNQERPWPREERIDPCIPAWIKPCDSIPDLREFGYLKMAQLSGESGWDMHEVQIQDYFRPLLKCCKKLWEATFKGLRYSFSDAEKAKRCDLQPTIIRPQPLTHEIIIGIVSSPHHIHTF
jgi:hypothetical protein